MRLLFINNYLIGSPNATGQTLSNMFSGMGDVEIFQYTIFPDVRQDYYMEGVHVKTVSNTKQSKLNNTICNQNRGVYVGDVVVSNQSRSRKSHSTNVTLEKIIKYLKKNVVIINEFLVPKPSEEIVGTIREFRPNVIYTLGANLNVLRDALYFSDILNIPIVMHNMDDIYNTRFNGKGLLEKIARKKMRALYREVYDHSLVGLAIGEKMQIEYEKTFSLPFLHAMNCCELFHETTTDRGTSENHLYIFSGGLHGGRYKTLLKLAGVIEKRSDVVLEVYTSKAEVLEYAPLFEQFSRTKIKEYVERKELFSNLSRADVLVHVESFFGENIDYFRLSMSTKIAEYVAVQRPILGIGSLEIATIDFIRNEGIGVVAENIDVINEKVTIMEQKLQNNFFSVQLYEIYKKYFDKNIVQEKIQRALSEKGDN